MLHVFGMVALHAFENRFHIIYDSRDYEESLLLRLLLWSSRENKRERERHQRANDFMFRRNLDEMRGLTPKPMI